MQEIEQCREQLPREAKRLLFGVELLFEFHDEGLILPFDRHLDVESVGFQIVHRKFTDVINRTFRILDFSNIYITPLTGQAFPEYP
jgi:hypothetical protein